MPTNEILNSHSVTTLKSEIAKTNIKGYSKMKKKEIIALMMKPEHSKRFSHIKMKDKTVVEKKEKPKAQLGESGIGKKRKREIKPIKKKVIDVPVESPKPKKKVIKKKEEDKIGMSRKNIDKMNLKELNQLSKDYMNYKKSAGLKDTKYKGIVKEINKREKELKEDKPKIPKITITEEEKPKYQVYNKGGKFFKPKEVKSKLPPIPKSNVKIRLPKKEEPKKEIKKEEPKKEIKKEKPKKEKKEKKSSEPKTLSQIPSNIKKLWKEFVSERVGSFLEKYQLEEYESLKNMEERFRDLEIKKKDKTLRANEKFNIVNDIGDIVEDIKENIEDEPRFDKVYKILTPRIHARVKADLKEKKKEESKN